MIPLGEVRRCIFCTFVQFFSCFSFLRVGNRIKKDRESSLQLRCKDFEIFSGALRRN